MLPIRGDLNDGRSGEMSQRRGKQLEVIPAIAESEMLRRIRDAMEKLDAEPGGPLAWLVAFARTKKFLPGEREAHGYRLLALVNPGARVLVAESGITPIAPKTVDTLHRELRTVLRSLVSGAPGRARRVDLPAAGLKVSLVRATAPGVKPAIFGVSLGGPLRAMLFQKLKDLIVANGNRLIECPECKEPFLALHKMRFCKSKCRQDWHDHLKMEKRKGAAR
jgi:hypothetical protein